MKRLMVTREQVRTLIGLLAAAVLMLIVGCAEGWQ